MEVQSSLVIFMFSTTRSFCSVPDHSLLSLFFSCFFMCCSQSNEHMFEIIVPRHCPLARIDVKFRLKEGESVAMPVLATLLHSPLSVKNRSAEADKSSRIWPLPEFFVGPIRDFVTESGASVACGPVALQSGLDGAGPSGHVTLSPPSQVAASCPRSTSFYLHFCAMPSPVTPTANATSSATLPVDELMLTVFQWPDESASASTTPLALPLSSLRQQLVEDVELWHALIQQALGAKFDKGKYSSQSAAAAAFARQQSQAMELLLWVAGMWSTHPKR